eukprot:6019637-Prymnesium_polylepis.1
MLLLEARSLLAGEDDDDPEQSARLSRRSSALEDVRDEELSPGVTVAGAAAFIARQRSLLVASIAAARAADTSTHRAAASAEGDVSRTLLEGWLEKRADNHLFKPWLRRYVRLLPGRLCWAHDEQGTKARELRLDAREPRR